MKRQYSSKHVFIWNFLEGKQSKINLYISKPVILNPQLSITFLIHLFLHCATIIHSLIVISNKTYMIIYINISERSPQISWKSTLNQKFRTTEEALYLLNAGGKIRTAL